MERLQIFRDDRIAGWIEKVRRGEDVVFTRGGVDVVEMKLIDPPGTKPLPEPASGWPADGYAIVIVPKDMA